MKYLVIAPVIFILSACASKHRQPAGVVVEVPQGSLKLEQALTQGAAPTFEYLRTQNKSTPFEGLSGKDPAAHIPVEMKAGKAIIASNEEKNLRQSFLRKFRPMSFARKTKRGTDILANFDCKQAVESQALGLSLEIDFPEVAAMDLSRDLHEKVVTCEDVSKTESIFRLAVFAIQRGDCVKSQEYLAKFPAAIERGVSDRLSYVRSLCSGTKEVTSRNPWGGYGILLGDTKTENDVIMPHWYLSGTSGNPDWDRLLATFIELSEKGQISTIQYLASKINFESFRNLPLPFQTSVMTVMSFNGVDLPVFQTLHRYLSDHPEMLSSEAAGLLFPVRFWKEIVENSKKADPVLVKALIRQESAFNPSARSRAKATGLMQLIFPTARIFGVKQKNDLLSPVANIHAGSEFLAQLITQFGSVELALAAYNAGPLKVREWQKRYPTDNMDLFVEMIPYTETREYVRLVTRNYKVYQAILIKPQVLGQK
jgi:hypothetical protein